MRAYEANMDVARKYEAERSFAALAWRCQAAVLRFYPDRERIAGVDALEAVCNAEWGSGLTLDNLRRLHGRLCLESGLTRNDVDQLSLENAAREFRKIAARNAGTSKTSRAGHGALETWKERVEFLRQQEAIVTDPSQKFALKKQIEEAEQKIRELG